MKEGLSLLPMGKGRRESCGPRSGGLCGAGLSSLGKGCIELCNAGAGSTRSGGGGEREGLSSLGRVYAVMESPSQASSYGSSLLDDLKLTEEQDAFLGFIEYARSMITSCSWIFFFFLNVVDETVVKVASSVKKRQNGEIGTNPAKKDRTGEIGTNPAN